MMPIVTDDRGQVVIGHGRLLAAQQLGVLRIPVVEIRHLSKAQLKAFRIADNRLAQHAHWDKRLLGEGLLELKDLNPDFDLSITGFSLPEIDLAIQKLSEPPVEDVADATAVTGVAVCQTGDIWELGGHRVLCGDARSASAFENLMQEQRADVAIVDPPSSVSSSGHVSDNANAGGRAFAQDVGEFNREQLTRFFIESCGLLSKFSRNGAIHFVFMDWAHLDALLLAGREVYAALMTVVVWVKRAAGTGSLYRSQHELICVFKSGTGRHTNNIARGKNKRNRTNVWRDDRAGTKAREGKSLLELSSTLRPLRLIMDALCDCSNDGDIVVDSFLGDGTTLLAAERAGRICRGIERDPLCVDTTIRRWQTLTGRDAVRVLDGKLFRAIEVEKEECGEQ